MAPVSWRRAAARVLLLAALLGGAAGPLAGQVRDSIPADSARIPRTRADSLRADSLRADSLRRDVTQRYLKAAAGGDQRVPAPSLLGAEGPKPAGARWVFPRDSIETAMAETVGDLLARIPGVFLWRGGWVGRAELPTLRARGATAVEYLLDGQPYVAIGPDSVAVDPAIMALSLLERVEVEQWPGMLRVHLFTRRHDRGAPRSRLGIARGPGQFARYQGSLEYRRPTKLSFGVAADYVNTGADPLAQTASDYYRNSQAWVQGAYRFNARSALVAQLVASRPRRLELVSGFDTLSRPLDGRRSDWQLRYTRLGREDGLGTSLDVLAARTTWSGSGVDQGLTQFGAVAGWRSVTSRAGLSAAWRSRWTRLDVRATAGTVLSGAAAVDGELAVQTLTGGRRAWWGAARGSLDLPGHFRLGASARVGKVAAVASDALDQPQRVTDVAGTLAWARPWGEASVTLTRASAFRPAAFQPYAQLPTLAATPATTWITGTGRLRPFSWLAIEGWADTPLGTKPEGQPPEHLVALGSIHTSFARSFPSGALDLKAQLGFERWGAGIAGRDAFGLPVVLPSAMYLRTRVELHLERFSVYFDRSNLMSETVGYVPGLPMRSLPSVFGFRWEFLN